MTLKRIVDKHWTSLKDKLLQATKQGVVSLRSIGGKKQTMVDH